MKFPGQTASVLTGLLATSLLTVGMASAQTGGLEALVEKAQTAMDQNEWQQALDFNRQAITRYGGDAALKSYGAQFGSIYYRKGLCEMKLKRWQDAITSFETCYRDFPNKGVGSTGGNVFQKLALLKWGEAAMAAGQWQVALGRFAKFTEERDRIRDAFPQGSFHINTAICHYKLGQVAAGNESLEIAIRNKQHFPTPEVGIVAAFQELVRASIATKSEQALLDFIGKNRGELTISAAEMRRFNAVFLGLAGNALTADMTRTAIAVYQFVGSDGFGADAPDVVRLSALAVIHEKRGNVRGALAAYRQLEDYYRASPGRAANLYQLVRCAALVGEMDLARESARTLFATFPDSPKLTELREAGLSFSEEELAEKVPPLSLPFPVPDTILPAGDGFSVAIDLYQGRKYVEAKDAFVSLRKQAEASSPVDEATAAFAGYQVAECLRKTADWKNLAKYNSTVPTSAVLGEDRLRQLEINGLWELARLKSWERLELACAARMKSLLPPDQRAQVACCLGLALEGLKRPEEALDAYQIALTADAGASEDVARQAALRILAIHLEDSTVRDQMDGKTPVESQDYSPLKEAAAVANLFEMSFGAGASLPQEFLPFLKFAAGK